MYPLFHCNLAPKNHEERKAIFRGLDFNRWTTSMIYNKAGPVAFSETWPRLEDLGLEIEIWRADSDP